jgi:hypothetical protein
MTQKQLNELREHFNKLQSETKETILKKRGIWDKEDNTRYERGVSQRYGKPQGKKKPNKLWK